MHCGSAWPVFTDKFVPRSRQAIPLHGSPQIREKKTPRQGHPLKERKSAVPGSLNPDNKKRFEKLASKNKEVCGQKLRLSSLTKSFLGMVKGVVELDLKLLSNKKNGDPSDEHSSCALNKVIQNKGSNNFEINPCNPQRVKSF